MTATERLSSLPLPESDRWQPLRLGLVNVYQYDQQTFYFHRGRLLLRGLNGSGKSVALESTLPYLLDASIAPERLSTFGGRDRSMWWKLIGYDNDPDRRNARAYMFCEFGRIGSDGLAEYFTIGAGLDATKADRSSVKAWYWTTSARVGIEFNLMHTGREPLARAALAQTLGDRGTVHPDAGSYLKAVNQTLYGLSDAQYYSLRNMLLELRKPKLSEKLDPDRLSGLLSDALPPINPTVIARLAGGFESMDRHESEVRDLEALSAAAGKVAEAYRTYAARITRARTSEVRRTASALDKARDAVEKAHTDLQAANTRAEDLANEIIDIGRGLTGVLGRRDALKVHPGHAKAQELRTAESNAQAERRRATALNSDAVRSQAVAEKRRGAVAAADKLEKAAAAASTGSRSRLITRGEELRAVDEIAELLAVADAEAPEAEPTTEFAATRAAITAFESERRLRLEQVRTVEQAHDAAVAEQPRAKTRTEKSQAELERKAAAVVEAERQHADALDGFTRSVDEWLHALIELRHGQAEVPDSADVDAVIGWTETAFRTASVALATADCQLQLEAEALARTVEQLTATLEELRTATGPVRPAPTMQRTPRAGREGAPLFQLVEFHDSTPQDARPLLEAACEAAGLLDAWIYPDGSVGDSTVLDTIATGAGPVVADSLAAYLKPDAVGLQRHNIDLEVIDSILTRVAAATGADAHGGLRVAVDGSWSAGVLHGRARKDVAELIGAEAQEALRQRQIAELQAQIDEHAQRQVGITAQRAELTARLSTLADEHRRAPSPKPINDALIAVGRAAALRDQAARNVDEAKIEEAAAAAAAQQEQTRLRDTASAAGLAAWLGRLGEYATTLRATHEAALAWHRNLVDLCRRQADLGVRLAELTEAELEAAGKKDVADEADLEALRLEEYAQALHETDGATVAELERDLAELADEERDLVRDQKKAQAEHLDVAGAVGGLVERHRNALVQQQAALEQRQSHEAALLALLHNGVLRTLGVEHHLVAADDADPAVQDDGPASGEHIAAEEPSGDAGPGHRKILQAARAIYAELGNQPHEQNDIDNAMNLLNRRRHDLQADLSSLHLTEHYDQQVLLLIAHKAGTKLDLTDLVAALLADLGQARGLLHADEQDTFRQFLTGDIRQEVTRCIRDADRLVKSMNDGLRDVATASGVRIKLSWKPQDSDASGSTEALGLLLGDPDLLFEEQRSKLIEFFRGQLDRVRDDAGEGTWEDKLIAILDYRQWYAFTVMAKHHDGEWQKLTRKTHGASSGGEKAVELHLPLFAAAAAHYSGAKIACPRLILLDEVFAGVDQPMRGRLFGLIRHFDLDLVATSESEAGTYAELDGISIYQLVRYEGEDAITAMRSIWDGEDLVDQLDDELDDLLRAATSAKPDEGPGLF
jgi:uncharacterized protein (TIGR02680 family)